MKLLQTNHERMHCGVREGVHTQGISPAKPHGQAPPANLVRTQSRRIPLTNPRRIVSL